MSNNTFVALSQDAETTSTKQIEALDWLFGEMKGSAVERTSPGAVHSDKPRANKGTSHSKEGSGQRIRKWLARCWLLGGLLLSLLLLLRCWPGWTPGGGTLQAKDKDRETTGVLRTKPIEQIVVGDRVLAEHPLGEEGRSLGDEVTPASWRRLELRAPKVDGSWADIVLLRPETWGEQNRARAGGSVHLAVPECGIQGEAQVLNIGPCPPIRPGSGRVVTGTFRHHSARLLDLHIEGLDAPVGTTANHPFWSEDRRQFVRADQLRGGERLRGERGMPRVLRVVPRTAPREVYNLEVHGTHVYHVTQAGVLVHNATPRIGHVYEITYVEGGVTRVYIGSSGSGEQDVYERLWGNRAGANSLGKGRDILSPDYS